MADVWNIKGGSSLFPIPKPLYHLSLQTFCQLSTTCVDKSNIDKLYRLPPCGNWPSISLYCYTRYCNMPTLLIFLLFTNSHCSRPLFCCYRQSCATAPQCHQWHPAAALAPPTNTDAGPSSGTPACAAKKGVQDS